MIELLKMATALLGRGKRQLLSFVVENAEQGLTSRFRDPKTGKVYELVLREVEDERPGREEPTPAPPTETTHRSSRAPVDSSTPPAALTAGAVETAAESTPTPAPAAPERAASTELAPNDQQRSIQRVVVALRKTKGLASEASEYLRRISVGPFLRDDDRVITDATRLAVDDGDSGGLEAIASRIEWWRRVHAPMAYMPSG